jgi:hypothetical protein
MQGVAGGDSLKWLGCGLQEAAMEERVTGAVQAIEDEAARLLDEASAEGEKILREARAEAARMDEEDPPLAEVEQASAERIEAARLRAREIISAGEAEAAALKERTSGRIDTYAQQIVGIVSGETLGRDGEAGTPAEAEEQ